MPRIQQKKKNNKSNIKRGKPAKKVADQENAFKNHLNHLVLKKYCAGFLKQPKKWLQNFDSDIFLTLPKNFNDLELKQRVHLFSEKLFQAAPSSDFSKKLEFLDRVLNESNLQAFEAWPFFTVIETYGVHEFDVSLNYLKKWTPIFTSEFAVRPYLIKDLNRSLDFLGDCCNSQDVHVRRWASEGSRPRLPWGLAIPDLKKDPRPTFRILNALKYDEELYVRKSVANHINDISKDNPELALQLLFAWHKEVSHKQNNEKQKIDWITKHAMRGLIKEGHPKALQLIGVDPNLKPKVKKLQIKSNKVQIGQHLEFSFEMSLDKALVGEKTQRLVIDYVIHHQKSNGEMSPKVFKLTQKEFTNEAPVKISKRHSFKPVTTRAYYKGPHLLEIQVNGHSLAKIPFELV